MKFVSKKKNSGGSNRKNIAVKEILTNQLDDTVCELCIIMGSYSTMWKALYCIVHTIYCTVVLYPAITCTGLRRLAYAPKR